MKKISQFLVPCFAMLGILFLGTVQAQTEKTKDQMQKADQTTPYTATYSSNFQMGDPKYAQMVLRAWKDWDDNALDRSSAMFADTLTMYHPDGSMMKGKDQNLAEGKKFRSQFASVKSTIQAYMSLKSIDKNENWVAIWGSEEDTGKDGKKSIIALHEVWRFNKDGKIDLMRQYAAQIPESEQ
jgi:hypothetical protein